MRPLSSPLFLLCALSLLVQPLAAQTGNSAYGTGVNTSGAYVERSQQVFCENLLHDHCVLPNVTFAKTSGVQVNTFGFIGKGYNFPCPECCNSLPEHATYKTFQANDWAFTMTSGKEFFLVTSETKNKQEREGVNEYILQRQGKKTSSHNPQQRRKRKGHGRQAVGDVLSIFNAVLNL